MKKSLETGHVQSSTNTSTPSKPESRRGERTTKFLSSVPFQTGAQLCAGQFFVSMFGLVGPLRFSSSCMAGNLFMVASLMLSPNNHVGAKLEGAAAIIGSSWVAAVSGGAGATLVRVIGVHLTLFHCLFGAFGLLFFASVRACPKPAVGLSMGITAVLIYGDTLLYAQPESSILGIWKNVVGHLIAAAALAGAGTALSGLLVIPTLASDVIRQDVGRAIVGMGHSISGYSSLILAPSKRSGCESKADALQDEDVIPDNDMIGEEMTDEEFQEAVKSNTQPTVHGNRVPSRGPGGGPVIRWRPVVNAARLLLRAASIEPPWMQRQTLDIPKWARLITATETLGMRTAVLEALLTSNEQLMSEEYFLHFFSAQLLTNIRGALAETGAICSVLGTGIMRDQAGLKVDCLHAFGGVWLKLKEDVKAGIAIGLDIYWGQVRSTEKGQWRHSPSHKIRAVLFLITLLMSLMDAVTSLEAAVHDCLCLPDDNSLLPQQETKEEDEEKGPNPPGTFSLQSEFSTLSGETHRGSKEGATVGKDTSLPTSHSLGSGSLSTTVKLSGDRSGTKMGPNEETPGTDLNPRAAPRAAVGKLVPTTQDVDGVGPTPAASQSAATLSGDSVSLQGDARGREETTGGAVAPVASGTGMALSGTDPHAYQQADRMRFGGGVQAKMMPNEAPVGTSEAEEGPVHDLGERGVPRRSLLKLMEAGLAPHQATTGAHGTPLDQDTRTMTIGSGGGDTALRLGNISPDQATVSKLRGGPDQAVCQSADRDLQQAPLRGGLHQATFALQMDKPHEATPRGQAAGLDQAASIGQVHMPDKATSSGPSGGPDQATSRRGMSGGVHHTTMAGSRTIRKGWLDRHFKWALPLIPVLFGWTMVEQLWDVYVCQFPQALKSWESLSAAVKDRWFQFWAKLWATATLVLCLILGLSGRFPAMQQWYLTNAYITIPIVMGEKVEMTVSKGVTRIAAAAAAGAFGFLVMLHPYLASNPYVLMAIMVTVTHVLGYAGQTQFKVAVFLLLLVFNSIILCQYTCAFCNHAGAWDFTVKMVMNVTIGCALAMAVSNLILPWYSSTTALQTLATAFTNAVGLFRQYFDYFYTITKIEADFPELDEATERKKAVPFPAGELQDRVVRLLGMVEVAMAREAVLWKHGIYTFPPLVKKMTDAMNLLQNRLTVLELVCQQEASMQHFGDCNFRLFTGPQRETHDVLQEDVVRLAQLTGQLLMARGAAPDLRHALADETVVLDCHRAAARAKYLQQREELHDEVRQLASSLPHTAVVTYDDTWRQLSWLFGFLHVLDNIEAVAKTALLQDCQKKDSWLAWAK